MRFSCHLRSVGCLGPVRAFTLVELLVVMAIIGLLVALLVPAIGRGRSSAQSAACLPQMKQLGLAAEQFADDSEDLFPRSQHSAFTYNELPWERSIARYLGASSDAWRQLLRGVYHCQADTRRDRLSYGLNVYFELGPDDDYNGKPDTWRHRRDVPHPGATVLFAENASDADHIMPNFWISARDAEDVASTRHRRTANYVFVDGHAESRTFDAIYAPAKGLDCWNPSTAP